MSWVYTEATSQMGMSSTPRPGGMFVRGLNRVNWLLLMWRSSSFTLITQSDWTPRPVAKLAGSCPLENRLYLWSHSFIHYPKPVTADQGGRGLNAYLPAQLCHQLLSLTKIQTYVWLKNNIWYIFQNIYYINILELPSCRHCQSLEMHRFVSQETAVCVLSGSFMIYTLFGFVFTSSINRTKLEENQSTQCPERA